MNSLIRLEYSVSLFFMHSDGLDSGADARGLKLDAKMGADSVRQMLSVAHAALGITPLILLSPRKCLNNIGSKEMLFFVSPQEMPFVKHDVLHSSSSPVPSGQSPPCLTS
jgi:hypothetical protein